MYIYLIYTSAGPGGPDGKGSAWRRERLPTAVFSCLENPMDSGAWWATVHGVANHNHETKHTIYISI